MKDGKPETLEEAMNMAEDLIAGLVLDEMEEGNKIPKSSKIENIELSELKFHKNTMINEFQQILVNSNFRVLKCLKLIFKMKLLAKNIGSIIMTILFL